MIMLLTNLVLDVIIYVDMSKSIVCLFKFL